MVRLRGIHIWDNILHLEIMHRNNNKHILSKIALYTLAYRTFRFPLMLKVESIWVQVDIDDVIFCNGIFRSMFVDNYPQQTKINDVI